MNRSGGNLTKTQDSLRGSLRQLLTWFLSPKSLGLEQDGEHAVHMVANHLAEDYAVLDTQLPEDLTSEIEIAPFEVAEYQGDDSKYLAPAVELGEWVNAETSEYLTDFMIHGSIATLDYSLGWSDFDTLVIVSKSTAINGRSLTELRTKLLSAYDFLTRIDPLQHHGFLVCTELDLRQYHESIMPLKVLQEAKSYFGRHILRLNLVLDIDSDQRNLASRAKFFREAANLGVMKHHAYEGTYLKSHYKNAENGLFQLKYLLGGATLAPCYYAGAINKPTSKRDAIGLVRPLLSEASRSFLDSATRVREEWPDRESFPYQGNRIPDWVQEIVEPDYINNVAILLTELENLVGDQA